MALTEDNPAHHYARPLPILPVAALDQLARLHVETSEASRLVKFLRSAVHVAALFMLMGACVLLLGGGPTIGHNFSWAALVLIGVTALLYSFIRTNAAVIGRAGSLHGTVPPRSTTATATLNPMLWHCA